VYQIKTTGQNKDGIRANFIFGQRGCPSACHKLTGRNDEATHPQVLAIARPKPPPQNKTQTNLETTWQTRYNAEITNNYCPLLR